MSDYFSGSELIDATLTFHKVKEEIERLRAENEQLKIIRNELQNSYINSEMNLKLSTDMIEQLKEAFKKCSPFRIDAYIDVEGACEFCGADFESTHADDCEYVRLTGG